VKIRAEYLGIADHPRIKNPRFPATIGKRIKPRFQMSSIALWVKEREKRPMLSDEIIPDASIWHALYVSTLSFSKCKGQLETARPGSRRGRFFRSNGFNPLLIQAPNLWKPYFSRCP